MCRVLGGEHLFTITDWVCPVVALQLKVITGKMEPMYPHTTALKQMALPVTIGLQREIQTHTQEKPAQGNKTFQTMDTPPLFLVH